MLELHAVLHLTTGQVKRAAEIYKTLDRKFISLAVIKLKQVRKCLQRGIVQENNNKKILCVNIMFLQRHMEA